MMKQDIERDSGNRRISVFASYGEAWRLMKNQFLELLLIVAVVFAFMLITGSPYYKLDDWSKLAVGDGRYVFTVLYFFLVLRPIEYGNDYVFLRAVRNQSTEVKHLFDVFRNYLNAVLGTILVGTIVGLGMPILIVPGIIFACKLAFVPYLIVDEHLDVLEAVRRSWNMTSGYSWRIFGIGFLAIFIYLLGLVLFGVGVIVSIIWVKLAFAVIYHRVRSLEDINYYASEHVEDEGYQETSNKDKTTKTKSGLPNMLER